MKDIIIEKLYKTIKSPYQFFFKKSKEPWNIKREQLLDFPQGSLGNNLGKFLINNHFDIQYTLEEHDVYHVLTSTGITVLDEIHMQFQLLGNGKRSPFVFIVIGTGLLFYPFEIEKFIQSFRKGKQAHAFHYLDFYRMLPLPLLSIQNTLNIK